MTDKPVLFLDNDFLINTYNATGQNDTLFNQIMDTYAQEYDVQITKAVFDEAVDLNAINPATGEPYPKDVAINNWMDSQSITSIETNTALGPNAGERSIIDAIKNDPALYDSETGIARDGTYRVASNDASYNGTDTELFQSERVGAETLAKESTIKGNTSVENYKLLYENSSESTINWENYKDVFKETFETKYSDGTIEYTENADGTIDYTIKKGSSSIKIAESGLFVEADPNTKMAVLYDNGSTRISVNISKFGSALETAGYATIFLVAGIGIGEAAAEVIMAQQDTAMGFDESAAGHYHKAGEILAETMAALSGGMVGAHGTATIAAGMLLAVGLPVASVGGILIIVGASLTGFLGGAKVFSDYVSDLYDDLTSAGFIDNILGDYKWAASHPIEVLDAIADAVGDFYTDIGNLLDDYGWAAGKAFDGIADWLQGVIDLIGTTGFPDSPLVLDLGAEGIDLSSTVYWDIDQDGMAEATSWVGAEDGLLAYDRNGDSIINDHGELFGTEVDDGFLMLAEFDTNGDRIIDANDADFSNLVVWIDANSDGYSQEGEMFSLTDLGITSISLNAAEVDYEINGNPVSSESTFTMNGQERTIVDAWLNFDDANSIYAGNYTMDVRALFLPTLKGYGDLPDLYISMSMDNGEGGLLEMVQTVATSDAETLFSPEFDLEGKITEILYTWAGVTDVDPASRGAYVDAREVAFLEALIGQEIENDNSQMIYGQDAQAFENAFNNAYNALAARILVQTVAAELFTETAIYDLATDEFEGTFTLDFAAIDTLVDGFDLIGDDLAGVWSNVARLIQTTIGLDNLSTEDYAVLNTIIEESDFTGALTIDSVWDSIYENGRLCYKGGDGDDVLAGGNGNDIFTGLGGDDTLYGKEGEDSLRGSEGNDTLYGGAGNDYLAGHDDNDHLYGESGDDVLEGGHGNDVYYYGSGIDTIKEASGVDTIVFAEGITATQIMIRYSDNTQYDLNIYIDGVLAITIDNYFLDSGKMVEYLRFSDGTLVELSDLTGITEGTSGDDTLVGNDAASFPGDMLRGYEGNDTLDGGLGNDLLEGGTGDDTYLITSGMDVVSDTGGTDTIVFGAGMNSTDVSYAVDDDGALCVSFGETLYATIENQFTQNGSIEILEFDDSVTIQASTLHLDQIGTSNSDAIFGYRYGADINNTIYAGAGNDRVYGGEGDDTIYGEAGNDSIYASSGDDILDGGLGDDYLEGSSGNDTYVITAGIDTIFDNAGTDTIVFGSAYDPATMVIAHYDYMGRDMGVYFNGELAAVITNFFSFSNTIETLEFDGGSTLSLIPYINIEGTNGDDTLNGINDAYFKDDYIYGYGGNDTLYGGEGDDTLLGNNGSDTLDGGSGVNYLSGGSGHDTYIYSDAGDTIDDDGLSSDIDVISFGAGITAGDIAFARVGLYDMQIAVNGIDSILVKNQFRDTGQIETLSFHDSTTINLLNVAQTLDGTENNDTLYGTSFGAGSDILNGLGGDDVLYGYSGDDILDGGPGSDILYGGTGNDVYLISDNGDVILDENGTDTIIFDASYYSINDLELIRSGNSDLIVSFNGTSALTISNQFDQGDKIEILQFNDGTFDLSTQSYTVTGDDSNNTLYGISYGGNPDDTLIGGAGDDFFYGGLGDDAYYVGTGVETISDTGGNDTIYLEETGLILADMTYERSDSFDLDIYFSGVKKLTLLNHLNGSAELETLVFADSSIMDLSSLSYIIEGDDSNNILYGTDSIGSIDEMYGYAGNDTLYGYAGGDTLIGGTGNDMLRGGDGDDAYEWSVGDGIDTIHEAGGVDQIALHGVNFEDIRFARWGTFELDIHIGDEYLRIRDQLRSDYMQDSQYDNARIESILLDDGTEIDLLNGLHLKGTSEGDTISGLNLQNTVFEGLGGKDYIYSKTGNDTFIWSPGDGTDYINDTGGIDQLVLHGVTVEDFRFVYDDAYSGQHNLGIYVGEEFIRINNQFLYDAYQDPANMTYQVENILLDDGTTIDITGGLTFTGTDLNDTVRGLHTENDVLYGLTGNDILKGYEGDDILIGGTGNDTLFGGNGDDAYEWSVGDGIDTIRETGGMDQIALHGVDFENIRFARCGSFDFDIHIGDEYLRIRDQLKSDHMQDSQYDNLQVENILLDDGTVIDLLNGLHLKGTSEGETISGLRTQDTVFEGLGGDDTLIGKNQNDTFIWSPGDGNDIITDAGGWDQLVLHSVTLEDIQFSVSGESLDIYAGEEYIRLGYQFHYETGRHFESILLDDGYVIDLQEGIKFVGTSGVDTISALSQQGTILEGFDGNDTLNGNVGDDTFIWSVGDGNDSIYEAGGTDQLVLHGVLESDIRFVRNGDDLETYIGGGHITIDNHFGATADQVESVLLDNGQTIDLTSGLVFTGTSAGEVINASAMEDVLYGLAGDDTLYGLDGADTLVGGDGHDQMYGGSEADTFVFEADSAFNDIDVIADFSLVDGDAIDVTSVLAGTYDTASDNITDFVQIVDNGSDSVLMIDQDGGADNFITIATLTNVTGLTDEQSLFANGSLLLNAAPIAQDDAFTGDKDTIIIGNVLEDNGNGADSDADGEIPSVVTVGVYITEHGTITIAVDGEFSYTPDAGFIGTDFYTYAIEDGYGTSDTATISITVVDPNNAPIAQDDIFNGNQDIDVTGNVLDDNGNGVDRDLDNDGLFVVSGTYATDHGIITITNDGAFTYTPEEGYVGTDSYTYTLWDPSGATSTATISLTILASNTDPIAQDDIFIGEQDTVIIGNVLVDNGNGADSDPDGDTLSVVAGTYVTNHGSVIITEDGAFTYTPEDGYFGDDSFIYTVTDGTDTDTATVTLTLESASNYIYGTQNDDRLYGSESADIIYGEDGIDRLYGHDGDDILFGGNDNDYLYGQNDNDTLYGDSGSDKLYGSSGDDCLYGGEGDDYLIGGTGNDLMSGGIGNDIFIDFSGENTFILGEGSDTVYSSGSSNTFIYNSADGFVDTIYGFSTGSDGDTLDLSDILTGYDPLTDDISEFVQATRSGWINTMISVDVDGGGDNFVEIAKLAFVMGVDSAESLEETGNLIAV